MWPYTCIVALLDHRDNRWLKNPCISACKLHLYIVYSRCLPWRWHTTTKIYIGVRGAVTHREASPMHTPSNILHACEWFSCYITVLLYFNYSTWEHQHHLESFYLKRIREVDAQEGPYSMLERVEGWIKIYPGAESNVDQIIGRLEFSLSLPNDVYKVPFFFLL